MYNGSNTPKRKGADDEAYAEGWDRIFGKKDKPNKGVSDTLPTESENKDS